MWLNAPLEEVSNAIRQIAPEALKTLLHQIPQQKIRPFCLVGEHQGENAATWYLSVLYTRDGDELAIVINAQAENSGTNLTADVSIEQRILFEQPLVEAGAATTVNEAESEVARAAKFLRSFFASAPAFVLLGSQELESLAESS